MSGVNTGFAAIAAEAFGLSPDQVRVVAADTATGPYSGASGGSKVTYTVGAAVLRAAEAAREKLLKAASEELEIAPADLEVVDGVVRAVGSPDHSITVAEISGKALRFGGRYEPIEGHGGSAQTRGAPSVAAHLAHVRVDRETGEVTLLAHVIAQDVGRALNPALVEGQMRGGAAQGIGWALFEELVHDESGQLLTSSFLDYAIPLADRVPDIDTLIVEVPAPDGPFGAKGIGEAPVIAAAPAIANARRCCGRHQAPRAADDRAARLGSAGCRTSRAHDLARAGAGDRRDATRPSFAPSSLPMRTSSTPTRTSGTTSTGCAVATRSSRRFSTASGSAARSSSASTSRIENLVFAFPTIARSPTGSARRAGSSRSCAST